MAYLDMCETSKIVGVYIYMILTCVCMCLICICTHTYICTYVVCFSINHALFLTRYFPFKTGFFNLCM